jgi:hypothetical protein
VPPCPPSPGTLFCTLVDRRSSVPLSDARVTCVIGGYLTDRLGQPVVDAAVTATFVRAPGTPRFGGPALQTYG